MIELVRCDDRLIHGQCIVRVLGDFGIQRIIGVDDFTATNPVLKRIYGMAVPPQVEGGIFTTEEAVEQVRQHIDSRDRTLLLFKSPLAALTLFQKVEGLPRHLNVGPMSSRKNARKATMYAYLTDEEIEALDALTELGVRVYFNQTSDQRTEEWSRIKAALKV